MPTLLRVLTDAETAAIHEQSLAVLARTGMRVDSARARTLLGNAGAHVDEGERRVRFPRALVEASLAAAPRTVTLGGRREGFSHTAGTGETTLMPDGESTTVYDAATGTRRAATRDDWAAVTRLADATDEVGLYWRPVNSAVSGPGAGPAVAHWAEVHRLFSKHIQDEIAGPEEAAWLLEVLGAVFGGREAVRRLHPFSVLFCPVSPLALEEAHTDAYLATAGWDIPVCLMPMPMMGTSAPTGLRSTIVSGHAEVLGALCLVQAMAPGTPVLYGPALAAMEPRSGRWAGGGPEHSLLGAAITEMGRLVRLPVTSSTGGADAFVPGIQTAYERTMNWMSAVLSRPDVLIGPGSIGGASTLSLEQFVLDVEVYRALRRIRDGIGDSGSRGIGETDVVAALDEVGPVGDFLARPETRSAVRGGEWFMPRLGYHGTFDRWEAKGRPDILDEARETAAAAIAGHRPLPMAEDVAAALAEIERRAGAAAGPSAAGPS